MSDQWTAATEERSEIPDDGLEVRMVAVYRGVRLFRVSDELAARSLLDWSDPCSLKIEKNDDGTYELVAKVFLTARERELAAIACDLYADEFPESINAEDPASATRDLLRISEALMLSAGGEPA